MVTDFSRAESDKLAFSKAIFTGLGAIGGLDAAAFQTGTGASDTTDRVIYDAATGNLFYDADGTGRRAQVLVASFGNIEHRADLRRLPYPGLIAALHRAAGKRTRRGDGSGWKAGPHNLPVRCWSRRVMVICCGTCSWLVGRRDRSESSLRPCLQVMMAESKRIRSASPFEPVLAQIALI